MIREKGFEIAIVNTEGLWYGLISHPESGFKYETLPYRDRNEAKRISLILCGSAEEELNAQQHKN